MVLNLGELTSASGCTNNVHTIAPFGSRIVDLPCHLVNESVMVTFEALGS